MVVERSDRPMENKKIRVIFQQPTLAEYRVPLYREIAKHEHIDLTVIHGESPNLPNCEADGFKTQLALEKNWFGEKARLAFSANQICNAGSIVMFSYFLETFATQV